MHEQIIIIGAGASGLMAGSELAAKGHHVTIIEARERAGGRIHTLENTFSLPVEAGAEFIHGPYQLSLKLAKNAVPETTQISGTRYQIWNDKIRKGDFLEDDWQVLTKSLSQLKKDVPIGTFLTGKFAGRKYETLRSHVKGFVEGFDVGDVNTISAFALRKEWGGSDEDHQYHISGGYVQLTRHLISLLEKSEGSIRFSSVVCEIQWKKGGVKVLLENGHSLHADKIIVTVPIGVLKSGAIRFTPALPDLENAFANIGYGGVIKFIFQFGEPFWESARKSLKDPAFIVSDAPIPTWWTQLPDRSNILTGWLGGPSTQRSQNSEEELFERAIESLQYIFKISKPQIKNRLHVWHIANWVTDPFALGAYAFDTVATARARKFLSTPLHNTIYFAGEALYKGKAMGTVEAALQSGKAVARTI